MKKILPAFFAVLFVLSSYPISAEASWWNPKTWGNKSESVSSTSVYPLRKLNGDEKSMMLRLGETVKVLGVKFTLVDVLEDSRCATDVQCIQAGTVRVKAKTRYALVLGKIIELKLGESYEFRGHKVTFDYVTPENKVGEKIAPTDYAFMFSLGVVAKDENKEVKEERNEEEKNDDKVEVKDEPAKKVSGDDAVIVMPLAKNMDILQAMRIHGEMHKQKVGTYDDACTNSDAIKALKGTQGGKAVCYDSAEGWSVTVPLGAGYYGCADSAGVLTDRMRNVLPTGITTCPMI